MNDRQPNKFRRWFRNSPIAYIALWIAAIWIIEIVDTLILGSSLQTNGIKPRDSAGLLGILFAPFLHSGFGHVFSNTAPFIAMGFLVSLRHKQRWFTVTFIAMFAGGFLTWLIASSGNHIGLSGIVFSYFGFLLGNAFFTRSLRNLAVAAVVGFLYGTMILGLVPQPGISWEGHLSGVVVGVAIAAFHKDAPTPKKAVTQPQPWEADEPWLD